MSIERYSPEQIQEARQTNLAEYLISLGVPLVKDGSRYRHREHDSLVFTKNAFFWNSRGAKGNSVDFLTKYLDEIGLNNLTFTDAVAELTGKSHLARPEPPQTANFDIEKLNLSPDMDHVIKYLCDTRKIDRPIVEYLIANRYLFQEIVPYTDKMTGEPREMYNALFPFYDEHRQIVGAEIVGTLTGSRFKGIKEGSAYGYGFTLQFGEPVQYVLFFESAIDLLSFIDIQRQKNKTLAGCQLVSLTGLKANIFDRALKAAGTQAVPVLCVDNDAAGQEFIEHIKAAYPQTKVRRPLSWYKDWNEMLCETKKSLE